jgi:hypothetical protein
VREVDFADYIGQQSTEGLGYKGDESRARLAVQPQEILVQVVAGSAGQHHA